MKFALRKLNWICLIAYYINLSLLLNSTPVQAQSELAAWSITSDGILKLRTKKFSRLEAFFQDGAEGKGTTTVYYLQTGYSKPSTPSSGTDETPGSWTLTNTKTR